MQNRAETVEMEQSDSKNTIMAIGGAALVLVGAGMMMTHPTVRRYASQVRLSSLLPAVIPGIERILRLRTR